MQQMSKVKSNGFSAIDVINDFSVFLVIPMILVSIARNAGIRAVQRHWRPSRQGPSFGPLNKNRRKSVITLSTTKESFGGHDSSLATSRKICRNYTRALHFYLRSTVSKLPFSKLTFLV